MDVNNLLFDRLTKLAFKGLPHISEIEGFEKVHEEEACSICKREISKQPSEFGTYAYIGQNSYKQDVTYCVCCAAFFQNNPEVLGIEKPKAPNTSQKFGMLAGSGVFIEQDTQRTFFFIPDKSADKLPEKTVELMSELGIEVVKITQFNQLSFLSGTDLNFPALWINNFGKKTTNLVSNLKLSTSGSALQMVTDDELNSSTEAMYKIDLPLLMRFSEKYMADKAKAKFKKALTDLSNGSISPKKMAELLEQHPSLKELLVLLPKDPHQRIELIRLAEKVSK